MKKFALFLAACGLIFAQEVRVQVDARDTPRHLFHTHLTIPVKSGPLTLLYPKWIPGEHAPSGPIIDMVGLRIAANSETIPWARDPVDMYAFHVTVPDGATALDVMFDEISGPGTSGFSSGASTTSELAVLSWNQLVLYPQGFPANRLTYRASLRIPENWKFGTALPVERESGGEIEFQPAPLNTLIDSPVSMGAHYRTVDLGRDGNIPHFLHLDGDSDRAVDISADQIREYKNLVREAGALFGSRHYRDYHFLLTMSDHVASFGLEHHESSDDRIGERGLIDATAWKLSADLLPHEFVHSWNGKYRRPAGLVDPDYTQPMKGNLLWVYEGLTEYLGEVLAARSGLTSPEQYRESEAIFAAQLDTKSGRDWRPLEDTAVAAQLLYNARGDYAGYRRRTDFYEEGALIWLDVDVTMREISHGKKSLNDFCRAFYGGPGGAPALKPYTFDDLVAALKAVEPYDWGEFLRDRVDNIRPHAPLGGIENGGWRLE
ncbi:MAG: M61 family peptidase, partial [Bryobacteraceae bacterium]